MTTKRPPHRSYYLKDGTRVPSVTTVIGNNLGWGKQALLGWVRKKAMHGENPNEIRDRAGDFGTTVHKLIEATERGLEPKDLPDLTDEERGRALLCVAGYVRWRDQMEFVWKRSELPLVSEVHGYGGTIDMIATVRGSLTLVDFKTSNRMGPDMRIQVAAYAHLYEENFGELPRCIVIHFGKTPNLGDPLYPPVYTFGPLEREWRAFRTLLDLNTLQKQLDPLEWGDTIGGTS